MTVAPVVPALVIDGLSFAYPDGRVVLDAMSLRVEPGERVALLGPNGAGKTTLALHLNGVLQSDDGTVTVNGLDVDEDNLSEIRRQVGLVFHNPDDQLFMPTVADDVAFGPANLGLRGEERAERVGAALAAVDAAELGSRTPHHLSSGEKRRAALATVLAMEPNLLVLDEPTSGLDPSGRRELADLLRSLDLTQLVITHDLPFALSLCPRSVIVSGGRVVVDGPTAEILTDRDLLIDHRLEPPYGFDPGSVSP